MRDFVGLANLEVSSLWKLDKDHSVLYWMVVLDPAGSRTKARPLSHYAVNHTTFFNQSAINIWFPFFRVYQKFLMTWSNFIRLCGKSLRKPFSRWQLREVLSLIKASLWTSTLLSLTMANSLVCTSTAGSRLVEEIEGDLLPTWDILDSKQNFIF